MAAAALTSMSMPRRGSPHLATTSSIWPEFLSSPRLPFGGLTALFPKPNWTQFYNYVLPTLLAGLSPVLSGLGAQLMFAQLDATATGVRNMLTSLIPLGTIGLEPLFSNILRHRDDTSNYRPELIGVSFRGSLALAIVCCLFSYILFATAPLSLNALNRATNNQLLGPTTITDVQHALTYDYLNAPLSAYADISIILFYQSRNLKIAALITLLYETFYLTTAYILINQLQFGITSTSLSEFISALLILPVIIGFQLKLSEFQSYRLFTHDLADPIQWGNFVDQIKKYMNLSFITWVAEVVNNFAATYVGIRFSPPGLIGGLSVAAGAAENITDTITSVASPHIAETSGHDREAMIRRQFIYAMIPNFITFGISIFFAPQLSNLLGGSSASDMSDSQLRAFVTLFMGGSLIVGSLLDVAYQTNIDRSDTFIPAIIVTALPGALIGLCHAFEAILGNGDNRIGCFAQLISLSLALIALWVRNCYTARAEPTHEATQSTAAAAAGDAFTFYSRQAWRRTALNRSHSSILSIASPPLPLAAPATDDGSLPASDMGYVYTALDGGDSHLSYDRIAGARVVTSDKRSYILPPPP
jgi:hypothetical protein